MNKPKITTFKDRIVRAVRAFEGKPVQTIELGVAVKRCDECESRNKWIFYLCDQRACDNCSYPECKHTTDITHAVNFKAGGQDATWWEKGE